MKKLDFINWAEKQNWLLTMEFECQNYTRIMFIAPTGILIEIRTHGDDIYYIDNYLAIAQSEDD